MHRYTIDIDDLLFEILIDDYFDSPFRFIRDSNNVAELVDEVTGKSSTATYYLVNTEYKSLVTMARFNFKNKTVVLYNEDNFSKNYNYPDDLSILKKDLLILMLNTL